MATSRIDLTNQFLIAMPGMVDGTFAGTVVYLCEHTEQGALGLVINKPIDITLKNLFEKVELSLEPTGTVEFSLTARAEDCADLERELRLVAVDAASRKLTPVPPWVSVVSRPLRRTHPSMICRSLGPWTRCSLSQG